MKKWEEREFAERERVGRELWRMLKTGLANQVGSANPYLHSVFATLERAYPWLLEGTALDGRRLETGEER